MLSVKYLDASIQDIARMSNIMLRKSSKFANDAYNNGIITSRRPYINEKTIRNFYDTGDCYGKTGKLTDAGKKEVYKMLKNTFGKANITLREVMNRTLKAYDKIKP